MKLLLSTTLLGGVMLAGALPALSASSTAMCFGEFAKVDMNNDGLVSGDEADNAAANEFGRIDSDGSGTISLSEWRNCGLAARLREDASAASTAGTSAQGTQQSPAGQQPWTVGMDFDQADLDKSGDVSGEEAAKAAEQSFSSASGEDKESFARAFGQSFAMIDDNGDGKVSRAEWDNRAKAQVEVGFERLDIDDNGQLSQSEYQEARNVTPESTGPVTIWHHFIR